MNETRQSLEETGQESPGECSHLEKTTGLNKSTLWMHKPDRVEETHWSTWKKPLAFSSLGWTKPDKSLEKKDTELSGESNQTEQRRKTINLSQWESFMRYWERSTYPEQFIQLNHFVWEYIIDKLLCLNQKNTGASKIM